MEKLIKDCVIIMTHIKSTYPQDEHLNNLIKDFHENLLLVPNEQHTDLTQELSDMEIEHDNMKNSIMNNQRISKA